MSDLLKNWRTYNAYYRMSAYIVIISIFPIAAIALFIVGDTINGMNLYYYSVIPGILLSILLLYVLSNTVPHIFYDGQYEGSITSHFCFFIGITLMTGNMAVFINYKHSDTEKNL